MNNKDSALMDDIEKSLVTLSNEIGSIASSVRNMQEANQKDHLGILSLLNKIEKAIWTGNGTEPIMTSIKVIKTTCESACGKEGWIPKRFDGSDKIFACLGGVLVLVVVSVITQFFMGK
jgi:hypothetical protein